jgi:glycine/D-amino acid oxidase-like deaminating enzyme
LTNNSSNATIWFVYDVVVVGAGIGGAAAAYFLGRVDQQVLVLEKEALPCYFDISKYIPSALLGISSNAMRETRPAQEEGSRRKQ